MAKLVVSLDGGNTYVSADARDVRVIYKDVVLEDGQVDVHVTLAPEGVVTDVYLEAVGSIGSSILSLPNFVNHILAANEDESVTHWVNDIGQL